VVGRSPEVAESAKVPEEGEFGLPGRLLRFSGAKRPHAPPRVMQGLAPPDLVSRSGYGEVRCCRRRTSATAIAAVRARP
jgi:hypothetical protein